MSANEKKLKDIVKLPGGKKLRAVREKISFGTAVSLADGIEALKSVAYTKFDSTLEVVMKLGVDRS